MVDDKARADYAERKRKAEYQVQKLRGQAQRKLKNNSPGVVPTARSVLKFLLGK